MLKYIPAWKTKKGDRLIFLAENHLFDNEGSATDYQLSEFLFYIPMGITPDGVFSAEVTDDGKAEFPHIEADGPWGSSCAFIGGPSLEAALAKEAA